MIPKIIEKFRAKGDVKGLIRALRWENDYRQAAAKVLEEMNWQPDNLKAKTAYLIVKRKWDECVEIGTPAVKKLSNALEFEDMEIEDRRRIAKALGKIGDKRAIRPLFKIIGKDNWNVDKAAVNSLGKIGHKQAVRPLIAILEDERTGSDLLYWTVKALGEIGDIRALEPLKVAHKKQHYICGERDDDAIGPDDDLALGNITIEAIRKIALKRDGKTYNENDYKNS